MQKEKREKSQRGFLGRMLVFLLAILAVIGLLAMAMCILSSFVNPERFTWAALFGLGFWPVFVYNVLIFFALLLLWSKKVWISVLALVIAIPGLMRSFVYKNQEVGQFRVMSYNVCQFKDYRKSGKTPMDVAYDIANMVKENNPDVLCLQEYASFINRVGRTKSILQYGEMLGMPYHYFHKKANFSGNVIYSKYPIYAVEDESPFGEENGYGAAARVDAGDKGSFYVVGCHLASFMLTSEELTMFSDTSNTKEEVKDYGKSVISKLLDAYQRRSPEVQQMISHIPMDGRPILLCGDFNDTPLSYTYYQLSRNGFKDGFRVAGRGVGRTYAGRLPLLRIDYVWCNKPIQPTMFKRIRHKGSDHYPVMMDFNIENTY